VPFATQQAQHLKAALATLVVAGEDRHGPSQDAQHSVRAEAQDYSDQSSRSSDGYERGYELR
jgi:hypothetical protein